MKKIGFIDYYLDEWHANNYPEFFKNAAGDTMEVCYAYGEIDSPLPGGMTNKEWSEKYGIPVVDSIAELIEKSDYIIVLAPDNPETHVRLTELALQSKKPVYIDKTFSLVKADALHMFENANAHNTPCYSSSSLYFSDELQNTDKAGITKITSTGSGKFEIYLIHQVEQLIYLMGYDAKRVMYLAEGNCASLLIEFDNNRFAKAEFFPYADFALTVGYGDKNAEYKAIQSDYFGNCIRAMAAFFESGKPPVPQAQTIAVVSVLEAGIQAKANPFTWVEV